MAQINITLGNIIDKAPKKYQAGLSTELREIFNCSTITEARKIMR